MKSIFSFILTLCCFQVVLAQSLPEGYSPCPVSELQGVWSQEGSSNTVILSFTTPTMMTDGNRSKDMSAEITKIVVQRSITTQSTYTVVGTIDNPKKGEKLTFKDEQVPYGYYDYKVNVYVGENSDFSYPISVIVGEVPSDFADDAFSAVTNPDNDFQVILSVRLPEFNTSGAPISMPFTKLEFGEMTNSAVMFEPVVFYTETNQDLLKPGNLVKYTTYAGDAKHTFTAKLYTEAGGNWPASVFYFAGPDVPSNVINIKVEKTEGGYQISWDAPLRGLNGGNIGDVKDITYTISRNGDEYGMKSVVLANKTSERSIFDNVDFTEETKLSYNITPYNANGEGNSISSRSILVGPASQIPYIESFDYKVGNNPSIADHKTWSKETTNSYGFCAWNYTESGTYLYNNTFVDPHSGSGMLYAYYDNWMNNNTVDTFTSGYIDISSSADPILSFWLYQLPIANCASELKVQLLVSQDVVDLYAVNIGEAEKEGWKKHEISLPSQYAKNDCRLRFVASTISESATSEFCSIALDDITVTDSYSTAIHNINIEGKDQIFDLNGIRRNSPTDGLYIINGKKVIRK